MRFNYKNKSINVIGTKEHIQGRINAYKKDEPKTIRWIENFDPNGIFYDVGSNIGGFSFLTKMIHSKMIVFSFEPNYLNYMVQVETIKRNKIEGLNPINMALNDCDSYDFFYYDKDKTTIYSTGVTTNGTPGSSGAYTQIVVSEPTPNILYYQCSSHGYMGSRIDIPSSTNVIDTSTAFVDSTGTAITFASQAFSIAQAVALG